MNTETFGCAHCWPTSADSAWDALDLLSIDARLVDESHFIVLIRSCTKCRQRFVSVFTETIYFIDGEDPQYYTILPITEQEVSTLSQAGSAITSILNSLAPKRRALYRDYPKGKKPRLHWNSGIFVGPHD